MKQIFKTFVLKIIQILFSGDMNAMLNKFFQINIFISKH